MVANRVRVGTRLSLFALASATAAAGIVMFRYVDPGDLPPVPSPPPIAQTTEAYAARLSSARGIPTPQRRFYPITFFYGDVPLPGGYAGVAENLGISPGGSRLDR
jgi:hypothetical protein